MASFLRAFTLPARSLTPSNALGAFALRAPWSLFASPATTPISRALGNGLMQQTRGMKVHSSVKKRCEHCKVRGSKHGGQDQLAIPGFFCVSVNCSHTFRLFEERPASDITDTCTSSARRTLDTSNDKVKTCEFTRYGKKVYDYFNELRHRTFLDGVMERAKILDVSFLRSVNGSLGIVF